MRGPHDSTVASAAGRLLRRGGFPRNLATLSNVDKSCLDDVASRLKSDPRARVITIGHADSAERYPEVVARARTDAAKQYLIERGVEAERITSRSAAATRPLDTGTETPPGRRNRRAEVWVIPEGAAAPEDSVADGSGLSNQDQLKQLPWPPPRPTFRYVLPRRLVIGGPERTLEDAFNTVRAALTRGGFDTWSVYAIGKDGFAVAARMECIRDDGLPRESRWTDPPPRDLSFGDLLKAIFTPRTGRYRIVLVLVTPRPVTFAAERPTRETEGIVKDLPTSGAGELTDDLAAVRVPTNRSAEVLVYELFKPAADSAATIVREHESQLTATTHILAAGLWRTTDLQ